MKSFNPSLVINKYKTKHILFGLLIGISIITNSGYVGMMRDDSRPVLFLLPLTLVFIYKWLKLNRRIQINYKVSTLIILLFLILVTFILNSEFKSLNLYVHLILMIFTAFLISEIVPFNRFINGYTAGMKYITIVSLFFYTLWNFFDYRLPFNILQTRFTSYYNGIVYFQLIHSPDRNIGIFWEPGLFASFLVIALIFQIIFKETRNRFTFVILVLGLLSTQSTAGYLLIPFLIILYILKRVDTWVGLLFVYLLLTLGVLLNLFSSQILDVLATINPRMFGKFINDSLTLNTRLIGPILNLRIFLSSPIIGVGFSNATKLFVENSLSFNIGSQTSTSTYFLSSMGIGGIIYSLNWLKGINRIKANRLSRISILIVFLIILNKEPHNSILVTYCIMFYFLNKTRAREHS